ncbi:LPP20 family lipoprotein [Caminibacter sp.]
MRYLIIILLFLGCAKIEIPKWFNKVYNDDSQYIYATGEGRNLNTAVNSALSSAISKVEVTLNSKLTINKSLIKSENKIRTYENISQNIQTYIPKIKIYNYKIIKKAQNKKTYVLIAIPKIKNAEIIFKKSKEEFEYIKKLSNIKDKIFIIKNYPKLIKKTDEILSNLYFAYTMFPSPEIKKLINDVYKLKENLKTKLQNTGFKIKKECNDIIKQTLTNLNIPIVNNGINIYCTEKDTKTKIMDYYIDTIKLNITLKNESLMNFDFICSGKSITSFNLAKSFALKECKKRLERKLKTILQIQP